MARKGSKMAIYQMLFFFFFELAKFARGLRLHMWTNQDLDSLSTSKWPSEPQFCERNTYIWQEYGQKWSYNGCLSVCFISDQSIIKEIQYISHSKAAITLNFAQSVSKKERYNCFVAYCVWQTWTFAYRFETCSLISVWLWNFKDGGS